MNSQKPPMRFELVTFYIVSYCVTQSVHRLSTCTFCISIVCVRARVQSRYSESVDVYRTTLVVYVVDAIVILWISLMFLIMCLLFDLFVCCMLTIIS